MSKTLYDKLWDEHVVHVEDDGTTTLYIDRHLMHEVTSPQAFEGLRLANRKPWRVSSIVATADHNTPTTGWEKGMDGITDPIARLQVETLEKNIRDCGCAAYFPFMDKGQGVILATQTLLTKKNRNMLVKVEGKLAPGLTGKDIALAVIGKIGTAGGTGCNIEFAGSAIRNLSMEGRMTLCNMAIEAGARSGLVAVDDKTIDYMRNRPLAPTGDDWVKAEQYWRTLVSDADAHFDVTVEIDAAAIRPMVSWGTSPEMVTTIDGVVPDPETLTDPIKKEGWVRALKYMGLTAGTKITDIAPDHVFIGSCTNARIEDLRAAAAVVQKLGRRLAPNVKQALVVPGSGLVRLQAERLDMIFKAAGFQWREPGCSMCLAMNADRIGAGDRCASTSNRNFEGRQGKGGRTHLVSPAMAAAAAVMGHFVDVSKLF